MKDEKSVRHRRTAGFRKRLAAIVLAAVFMSVFVPFCSEPVFANVDLSNPCSLTVTIPSDIISDEEAQEAQLVVDLYRIAYATPDEEGFDTYHWMTVGSIGDQLQLPEGMDRSGWTEKTAEAAKLILGSGNNQWDPAEVPGALANTFVPIASDTTGTAGVKAEGMAVNVPITGLTPGIYLIIPRGNNIKEYASVNQSASSGDGYSDSAAEDATAAAAQEDVSAVSDIVTLARSDRNTYQFAPQLIALPTKEALDTGEINTATPSDWIYDTSIVLKPSQMAAGGDLEIVKDLDTYELRKKNNSEGVSHDVIDDATFVFEVSAYASEDIYRQALENGEEAPRIYHDFKSITFKDAYEKNILIQDIPVGSYVVVTEVYSGRSYSATVDTTQTTVIKPDEPATVTFKNTYDGRHGGGGSVTNNFKYGESGWDRESVDQVSDNSTEAEHISYPAENGRNN